MAKQTNNDPMAFLESAGYTEDKVGDRAKKAIALYQKVKTVFDRNPDNKEMQKNMEMASKNALTIIKEEVDKLNDTSEKRSSSAKEKRSKRSSSLKVAKEETTKVKDKLAACREVLKEERQRKLDSGEIKPTKRKNRIQRLQDLYKSILKLCPEDDQKVVSKAEKELKESAGRILKIYGLNQIEPIERTLKEVADKKAESIKKAA